MIVLETDIIIYRGTSPVGKKRWKLGFLIYHALLSWGKP